MSRGIPKNKQKEMALEILNQMPNMIGI